MAAIDGAAWLRELKANPGQPVLLPHGEALALAHSLAETQARDRHRRLESAIAGIVAG